MTITPRISDTARARVAKDFSYLPADVHEIAAGWLTLIEDHDAAYQAKVTPPSDGTAIAARPPSPMELRQIEREWRETREPLVRGLSDLLSIYSRPLIISTEQLAGLSLSPPPRNS